MTDIERGDLMANLKGGFTLLIQVCDLLSMMPLSDWQTLLQTAEALGPSIDPETYDQYRESNGPIILQLISAALPLQATVRDLRFTTGKPPRTPLDGSTKEDASIN